MFGRRLRNVDFTEAFFSFRDHGLNIFPVRHVHLYKNGLDENLQLTGKVEDIAPGEKIYSVRFMGDRGYLVTFKSVDPFFVLDLKDPAAPAILGALKIPEYSDYLHPYDEYHIIGDRGTDSEVLITTIQGTSSILPEQL